MSVVKLLKIWRLSRADQTVCQDPEFRARRVGESLVGLTTRDLGESTVVAAPAQRRRRGGCGTGTVDLSVVGVVD